MLLSLLVGRYAANFDLRLVASVAFVAMGATCFMRSDFTLDIDFRHVALMQALMGVGVALFFMPTTVILLSDLEAHGDRLNAAQVRRLNDPPCPARARRP